MRRQAVTVLGATGSIGQSTLDVIARHPDRFSVYALTAHRRVDALADCCRRHRPDVAVVATEADAVRLRGLLADGGLATEVRFGPEALVAVAEAPEVDQVMAAIVGAAGLAGSLAAAHAGKRVLLANKEALVMAGPVFMDAVCHAGAELLPIDSEHNALFQCMPAGYAAGSRAAGVRRLLLTASGGPFRERDPATLADVTPEEAVAHPNWSMGQKISVDSATMMNKGLELIEACWLFDVPPEKVEIVIHPESIVHSLVEYVDGSVLAQLGEPDMRTPIANGMAWPERIDSGVGSLDLIERAQLRFEAPEPRRFPCLALAAEAARLGGTAPAVLNAANEIAVAAFLDRRIGYPAIPAIIEATLAAVPPVAVKALEEVLAADGEARVRAEELLGAHAV